MFGSLMTMACITIANMRKRVLLHHLILVEVCIPRVPTHPHAFPLLLQTGAELCAPVLFGLIAALQIGLGRLYNKRPR
jgi:hypothetical protein